LDDDRWEDDEEEEKEEDDEDYDDEYDSDTNPLPSASKYPPSKAQREEDEKFKNWLSHTKDSSM
jgi:hypothetical protein